MDYSTSCLILFGNANRVLPEIKQGGVADKYILICLVNGGLVWALSTFMGSTPWASLGIGVALITHLLFGPDSE